MFDVDIIILGIIVCVCPRVHMPEVNVEFLSQSLSTLLLRQSLSLNLKHIDWLYWLLKIFGTVPFSVFHARTTSFQ